MKGDSVTGIHSPIFSPMNSISSCVVVIFHDFFTRHNGIAESGTFFISCLRHGLRCITSRSVRCRNAIRIVFCGWRFGCSVHIQIGIMCEGARRSETTASLAIIPANFLAIFHLRICICVDLFINRKSDKCDGITFEI